jgi:hypothetical protein
MGVAIANIDRLRRATSATVLLVHHTVKGGGTERGSSALRGAADVMIECSCGAFDKPILLKCTKMKDAEPFRDAGLNWELVNVGPFSSLAIKDWRDAVPAPQQQDTEVLKVLEELGTIGASQSHWKKAYLEKHGASKESTFNRALRRLKESGRVRLEEGKYHVVVDIGVSVNPVSEQCHDTSHEGVTSLSSLGKDTDVVAARPDDGLQVRHRPRTSLPNL